MANELLKVKGGPEIVRALRLQRGRFLKEMQSAIPTAADTALAAAQAAVPRATGTLAASAGVTSEVADNRVTAVVAYRDPKAAAVHEGIHHGHKVAGTRGFKWLEHSFKEAKPKMLDSLVKALRALTGG